MAIRDARDKTRVRPGQPAAQIQYHKVVAQPVHLEEGQPGRMRMRHGRDIGRTDGFRQMG